MRILAIDPGPTQSAFVVWDQWQRLLNCGILPNDTLLRDVQECHRRQTTNCVIEMIGHYGTGMPAGREIFDTCVWIGRFGERYGWESVQLILRPTVKAHICGSARAKDANVRQALLDKFGGQEKAVGRKASPGPLYRVKTDMWSALAVALTFIETCPDLDTVESK